MNSIITTVLARSIESISVAIDRFNIYVNSVININTAPNISTYTTTDNIDTLSGVLVPGEVLDDK